MAWFWSDACFSLHHGFLFYVISFEVSGSSVQDQQHLRQLLWWNYHYDKLLRQCGGGNIGLTHLVATLPDPTVCESFVPPEQTKERFESWHARAHSAEHPCYERRHSAGQTLQFLASTLRHFSQILSICKETVFKTPKWFL